AESAPFVRAARARGASVLVFPVTRIVEPASWTECDGALRRLGEYDAVAFVSAHGVRAFFDRCRRLGIPPAVLEGRRYPAVGPATAREIERAGLKAEPLPPVFTATALAESLGAWAGSGRGFLLPRGDLGRTDLERGLAASGARTESIVVYRTVPAEPPDADAVCDRLARGGVDVVVFASPSAVAAFRGLWRGRAGGRMPARIAVLGPTTAEAVVEAGWEPSIRPARATMADLLETIEDVCREG
ncbi:MAG: uroporphyrinogen-III synthase, partial [Bacteroidota bacterium]